MSEAAARRRHPTALWLPDVERMRRRLREQPRGGDVRAEPPAPGDRGRDSERA